jgi:hypothetical protein
MIGKFITMIVITEYQSIIFYKLFTNAIKVCYGILVFSIVKGSS